MDRCQCLYVIIGLKAICLLVNGPGDRFQVIRVWPAADRDGAPVDQCAYRSCKDHLDRVGNSLKIYAWRCGLHNVAEGLAYPGRVVTLRMRKTALRQSRGQRDAQPTR